MSVQRLPAGRLIATRGASDGMAADSRSISAASSAEAVKLSAAADHGTYKVSLKDHLDAVRNEETLLASVLIHSYALAENAAAERLGGDARAFGGIEDWGTRLLATTE